MNHPTGSAEQRRAPRKRAASNAIVTDTINGQPLGQLGNLSASGMLLIGPREPRSEAVYQVSLPLSDRAGAAPTIEIGIQEQWHEPAASPGQIWAGYRIIAIATADAALLEHWLQQG